jgi:hypothetical protein
MACTQPKESECEKMTYSLQEKEKSLSINEGAERFACSIVLIRSSKALRLKQCLRSGLIPERVRIFVYTNFLTPSQEHFNHNLIHIFVVDLGLSLRRPYDTEPLIEVDCQRRDVIGAYKREQLLVSFESSCFKRGLEKT